MTAKLSISDFQIKQPQSAANERAKFANWSEEFSNIIAQNHNCALIKLSPIFKRGAKLYKQGHSPATAYALIESEITTFD